MSDIELLESALKGAGLIEGEDWINDGDGSIEILSHLGGQSGYWNPLEDDADALRLAVTLKMQIIVHDDWVEAMIDGIQLSSPASCYPADGCMFETARRAIVRAAAAIGSEQP